jgi:hexosaminidase
VALRYTTDATEPTLQSALVNGPIADKALIHVAAFDSAGRKGRPSQVDNR